MLTCGTLSWQTKTAKIIVVEALDTQQDSKTTWSEIQCKVIQYNTCAIPYIQYHENAIQWQICTRTVMEHYFLSAYVFLSDTILFPIR